MTPRVVDGTEVEASSGNVFADLGLAGAEKLKIKSGLMIEITKAVRRLGLTQEEAGQRMALPQPKVSALRHYKLAGFSLERLMNLLTALDQDVEIVIRRKPRSRRGGRISVVAA